MIDQDLAPAEGGGPGMARDVSAGLRGPDRLVTAHGGAYLLPTIVRCGPEHPLANREFLFPYASVVEVPAEQLPECLGPSLVVTCISNDPAFQGRFVASSNVDRLNVGGIPTTQISWDQPHEGNLFEHLYARRAYQTGVTYAS